MPKISLDMPSELLSDLKGHVGDDKKFISVADAIVQPVGNCWTNWTVLMHDKDELVVNDMTTRKDAGSSIHLLTYLDSQPNREGLKKTPQRVIDSWDEVFAGYKTDAESILQAIQCGRL